MVLLIDENTLPPKKWEKTKWIKPTQQEIAVAITKGSPIDVRPDWEYVGRKFGHLCCLKARIKKVSCLSQETQESWQNGEIDDLQPYVMAEAYVDVQWNSDAYIPEELLTHNRITKCVYDCGLFNTARRVIGVDDVPEEPFLYGFQNIPWFAFSQECRLVDPDDLPEFDGATYSDELYADYIANYPLEASDVKADIVLVLYDPMDKDSSGNHVSIEERLILVGHSNYQGTDCVDHETTPTPCGLINALRVSADSFIIFRNGFLRIITLNDKTAPLDYLSDLSSWSGSALWEDSFRPNKWFPFEMPTTPTDTRVLLPDNKAIHTRLRMYKEYYMISYDNGEGVTQSGWYPIWVLRVNSDKTTSRDHNRIAEPFPPEKGLWANPYLSTVNTDYPDVTYNQNGRVLYDTLYGEFSPYTDQELQIYGVMGNDLDNLTVLACTETSHEYFIVKFDLGNDNSFNSTFTLTEDYTTDTTISGDGISPTQVYVSSGIALRGVYKDAHLLESHDTNYSADGVLNTSDQLLSWTKNKNSLSNYSFDEIIFCSGFINCTESGITSIGHGGDPATTDIQSSIKACVLLSAYLEYGFFMWLEIEENYTFSGLVSDFDSMVFTVATTKKCMLPNGSIVILETFEETRNEPYIITRFPFNDGSPNFDFHPHSDGERVISTQITYLNNFGIPSQSAKINPLGEVYKYLPVGQSSSIAQTNTLSSDRVIPIEYIDFSEDKRIIIINSRRLDDPGVDRKFLLFDGKVIDDDFKPEENDDYFRKIV